LTGTRRVFVLKTGMGWEDLPPKRPAKLHANKAYDSQALRERLGRYHWVAERTAIHR